MLLQFSVENFRSIAEKQTLILTASNYFKELLDENSFSVESGEKLPRILRSAAIYGPNAAGKSSLVHSMDFVRWFVVESLKRTQIDEPIGVTPFLLSSAFADKDSSFEIVFLAKDETGDQRFIRYQYGIRVNIHRITEEWLIAYPNGRPQRWFHRIFDAGKGDFRYDFGTAFKGGRLREDWKSQTRENALFLSTAVQLNNEQLKPVFFWFSKHLKVLRPGGSPPSRTFSRLESDPEGKVLSFMKDMDLSIDGISFVKRPFSPERLPKNLPSEIREEMIRDMSGKEVPDLRFLHSSLQGNEVIPFDPGDESEGTINLFSFSGLWLDMLEMEQVLVIDEIETSLHPLVVRRLIERLHCTGCQAQLIFTTHDSSLLASGILRRDQIWFVEKNPRKATELYSLSDFSVQKGEALEKRYLSGRYGAIPFFRDLELNEKE
ncbi:MAG: AAA family ATPase [Leptospirales bacterium]